MKKYITILLLLLLIAVFTTCKKEPDAPIGGNKIEMGETEVDTVSYFEAQVSSALANTGGNEIIQHGHCWSTKNNPTTDDARTTLGKLDAQKSYTSQLTDLNDNTAYYIRSYVTYPYGTVYGAEQNIKTLKAGKPLVNTLEVQDVDLYSAKFNGKVIGDSGLIVTARGFCWDTVAGVTISNSIDTTLTGKGLGSFYSEISSLNEGITYYVKAYAINEEGISYGESKQFTTVPLTLPEVTTNDITEITINSATSGGNVTSNGNGTVTARGVCWNTTGNPTLENNEGYTTDGTGTGSFTSSITGLDEGVEYFVRAYAINEKGTGYGENKQFTTTAITLPEVTTAAITEITINSAKSGGNVTSDGNSYVTARGVCWNTSGNPTLENSLGHTMDGSNTGSFTSNITGLTENTTYYVAAYATNEKGNAYGQVKEFVTQEFICGQHSVNYGGQTYHTVKIGNQCWMKENLNIGTRINGSEEMLDNQQIEKYCYDDNEANCDEYGGLYQWDEMMQYITNEGAQGICPDGWHIPSDEEWKTLEMYLGMSQSEADQIGWRGTDEGEKLKNETGWNSGGNGSDEVGFSALPGGSRVYGGDFGNLGYRGTWRSATAYGSSIAWSRGLNYDFDLVSRYNLSKGNGFSVRCVRD